MSAWGTGIFADDFAMDLKREYQTLLAFGIPNADAFRLVKNYFNIEPNDDEDYFTFYLATASIQRKYGLIMPEVKETALDIISNGKSLEIWEDSAESSDVKKRIKVLEKLKDDLLAPPLPARKVPKPPVEKHRWNVGDIVAGKITCREYEKEPFFHKYVLLRVVEIDTSSLSKIMPGLAVNEWPLMALFDWMGTDYPDMSETEGLPYFTHQLTVGRFDAEECVHLMTVEWIPKNYRLALLRSDPSFVREQCFPISKYRENVLAVLSGNSEHFAEICK